MEIGRRGGLVAERGRPVCFQFIGAEEEFSGCRLVRLRREDLNT